MLVGRTTDVNRLLSFRRVDEQTDHSLYTIEKATGLCAEPINSTLYITHIFYYPFIYMGKARLLPQAFDDDITQ